MKSKRRRWEYLWLMVTSDDHEIILNRHGQKGWEFFHIDLSEGTLFAVAKREETK